MKWKITDQRMCLKLISAIILLIGLGSAVLIYQTADADLSSVLGYEMAGGSVYPITPENSKIYKHNLELYGGKAAVLADEFRRWFEGLWHGKSLAFTVAFITIFVSFGVFFVANHLPSHSKSDVRSDSNQDRPPKKDT
jgi:hypothetical protein